MTVADSWALVAFSGRTDLYALRLLKPGFRHCFLVLPDRGQWLVYDPMAHATALQGLPLAPGTNVIDALLAEGFVVVPARVRAAPRRPAPIAPFTCVEAVKRALGIHARRVVTPWDLFRLLTDPKNPKKILDQGPKAV
jgi:hypothetical protein